MCGSVHFAQSFRHKCQAASFWPTFGCTSIKCLTRSCLWDQTSRRRSRLARRLIAARSSLEPCGICIATVSGLCFCKVPYFSLFLDPFSHGMDESVCLPGGSCKAWHPMTTGSRSWNLCCSLPLPQEFLDYHPAAFEKYSSPQFCWWPSAPCIQETLALQPMYFYLFLIPHQKQPNPPCQIWNKYKIQNSFKFQKKRFIFDLMATMCH